MRHRNIHSGLLFFIGAYFFHLSIIAQSCLPEGISFQTQAQIDNFVFNHPKCTEIEGDVIIQGEEILNLNGLSVITDIWGSLTIYECNHLKFLSGLDQLTEIGASLSVVNNDSLVNFTGLGRIDNIAGNFIIENNELLFSAAQLENLVSVGQDFIFTENESFSNLKGVGKLESIRGALDIFNNYFLTDISGFNNLDTIGDRLWIETNYHLIDISGFQNLEYAGGRFMISDHPDLVMITGFGKLSSIGEDLRIILNYELPDLDFLNSLTNIGTSLTIDANYSLTDIEGLRKIESQSILNLHIINNSLLAVCNVESICSFLSNPNGSVFIENNTTGCNSKDEVIEACETIQIKENVFKPEFGLYLNAEQNELHVNSDLKIMSCNIYSGNNLQVCSIQVTSNVIKVPNLPRGLYIVELFTDKPVARKKVLLP